jgi:acyl-CoA thioester hydrolase
MHDAHDAPSAGRLVGREHRLPVRVYYEDTDFTGVVYHANYVRYFERGRSDFLRLIGADHASGLDKADPAAFVIARMEIDFIKPARIDEALVVVTTYETLKGARLDALQRIEREGEVLATAKVFAACIDLRGRPRRPHPHLVESVRPYLPPAPAASGGV